MMEEKHISMMTEAEILKALRVEFADDEEAIEQIDRVESDLDYMKSDMYNGNQTPRQHIMELVGFLKMWC